MIFTPEHFPTGFDAEKLRLALVAAHGESFGLETAAHQVALDDRLIDASAARLVDIMSTCKAHFSIDWNAAREINPPILAEIAALEAKWLRPFRDGETDKAAEIAKQIANLRSQLIKVTA